MIAGVCDGDVAVVTRALEVVSQAIDGMRDALKLMNGKTVVITYSN